MAEEARIIKYSEEQLDEMALVDIAYEILRTSNEPVYYRDLMQEVSRIKGLTQDEVNEMIARLYTEINIDGRFICIGNNIWGLKRWFPVDKTMDKGASAKGFIRKEIDEDYDDDDEDLYEDIDRDEDEFEGFGEDDEDLTEDEEFDADEEADEEMLAEEESLEELGEAEEEELDEEEEDF